jgi:hypothetical protein
MNVPSTTEMTVETAAISTDVAKADARPSTLNGSVQWSSVKPDQVRLKRPSGSLNENCTTMKIGMKR